MTTLREYECNLCRGKIKDTTEGMGFFFGTVIVSKDDTANIKPSFSPLSQSENHICYSCLKSLYYMVTANHGIYDKLGFK